MPRTSPVIPIIAALLVGACVSTPTVGPSEPHGIVSTELPSGGNAMRITRITEIDGVNYSGPNGRPVWLAPGRHTLRVTAQVRTQRVVPKPSKGAGTDPERVLELVVEEGKRYLIGAMIVGDSNDDWVPVVVQVSDI